MGDEKEKCAECGDKIERKDKIKRCVECENTFWRSEMKALAATGGGQSRG